MKITILSCLFTAGLFTGCIAGTFDSDNRTVDRLAAVSEVTPDQQALTADGPITHLEECKPAAETRRLGSPTVEIGVSTPVGNYASNSRTSVYSRYACH